ncbi:MAG: hypothetical protein KatS3mg131_3607 [Candidatus Tectimicrobiota bacterium]|nr:MAG: hypothetical protein KatS3mg131_3607 [Candidatus Tectomicrobia bacterium]
MERLLKLDWDAVAGIVAAVIALLLHFLHVIEAEILLSIALVLLALLFLRDLRREGERERALALAERTATAVTHIQAALRAPEVVLIGPRQLRPASARFAQRARGDMVWFNVCLLMFKPQALFDTLLRPAIENPHVTAVQFIADEGERALWYEEVLPKVQACTGHGKVREPHWCRLHESVSFILADTERGTEALLSFWGEPFMARTTRDVPRYVFHVQAHSELIPRLSELERTYRLSRPS